MEDNRKNFSSLELPSFEESSQKKTSESFVDSLEKIFSISKKLYINKIITYEHSIFIFYYAIFF